MTDALEQFDSRIDIGSVVPGTMLSYYNPAAPAGKQALTVVVLQSDQNLMQFCFAALPSLAQAKAREYWAKKEATYAPKIDKRRTTDPMARLAKAQTRLADLIGEPDDET